MLQQFLKSETNKSSSEFSLTNLMAVFWIGKPKEDFLAKIRYLLIYEAFQRAKFQQKALLLR